MRRAVHRARKYGTEFAIAPDDVIHMPMKDGKIVFGAEYVGGLFAGATRRVR